MSLKSQVSTEVGSAGMETKMSESESLKISPEEILEQALKAREEFLKQHPHLQSFQDEIDRIMEKAVGFENRMSVLAFLMEKKLYELRDSVASLRSVALNMQSLFDKTETKKTKAALDYSTPSNYLN